MLRSVRPSSIALGLAALLVATAVACTSDDPPPPEATASVAPTTRPVTQTASPSATPWPPGVIVTPTALPTAALADSRAVVDEVIEAVTTGDVDGFGALLRPRELNCSDFKEGDAKRACSGGTTSILAFPAGVCAADWYSDPGPIAERFVERAGPLFAVIEGSPRFSDAAPVVGVLPSGDFRVVFEAQVAGGPLGYVAVIDAGAVTLLQLGCSTPQAALLADIDEPPAVVLRGDAFILPTPTPESSLPGPEAAPVGERTGIPSVDRVLQAVESGDQTAFRSVLVATPMQCTHRAGIGSPPPCHDGELEATVVDAFLVAGCEGGWIRADLERRAAAYQPNSLTLSFVTAPNREGWYELIFTSGTNERPTLLWVSTDGVVGIAGVCSTVEQWAEQRHIILRGPAWPPDPPE